MSILDKTIVALDNMDQSTIATFLQQLNGKVPTIKVGLELFVKHGTDYLVQLQQIYPCRIFLDLKLHDIPNTVHKAILALKGAPIHLLTIHTQGGEDMISSAMDAARSALPNTKVLGVSYLTSLGEQDFKILYGIDQQDIPSAFERLFSLALKTQIDGVVLSPHELPLVTSLEHQHQHKLVKVCPGIRFSDEIKSTTLHDQKRVLSPQEAVERGADYLVIGRSLTASNQLNQRLNDLESK